MGERARALADQTEDEGIRTRFAGVAEELGAKEETIATELLAAQGAPADIGGYYLLDRAKAERAMRPSATFNAIIDAM